MKILYLFDQKIELDTRAQKEIVTFVKNGHEVKVYEWNKDEDYRRRTRKLMLRGEEIFCVSNGIRVKKNKGFKSNIFRLLKFEWRTLIWLLKHVKRFDIVYCVNLDTAYVCYLSSKMSRIPYIYDVFDDYADAHHCGNIMNRMIKRIDYRVMKKAKKVVLCSEKRKQQIKGPLDNCEIIYNVPDITISEKADCRTGSFIIAYVGNLTENRMIEDLLAITALHPEWQLECGGDGVLKELVQQYADEYSNIHYHGIISYEDVIRLEQTADVIPALYHPNVKNNTFAAPNKLFEAMSLGKPTIMVRNTGMDDLVEQEKTGLMISCDRKALENALETIRNNIQFWQNESTRIQRVFNEKYHWNRMEKRLLDMIL